MIEFIFLKILFMSIGMSVVVAIVWGATKVFAGVFSKRLCFCLWLVPLILSIIPIAGIPTYHNTQSGGGEYVSKDYIDLARANPQAAVAAGNSEIAGELENAKPIQATDETLPTYHPISLPNISYIKIFASIYFAVVAALLACYIVKAVKFKTCLRKCSTPCNIEMLELCKNPIGIKKDVAVYSVMADCSPFVYGVLRPKIIIPNEKITYEALLHELTHIKRGDLWCLFMLHLVRTIHFFNPLVYLYSKQIKKAMELACDEHASSVMNAEQRLAYSKSILVSAAPLSSGIACLSENGKNIEERIGFIMENKKRTRVTRLIGIALALVLISGQIAFAAAINEKSPANCYIINNATEIYSVVYQNGKDSYWSGKSGRLGSCASLINTAIYKGFSADLKLEFIDLNRKENAAKTKADMHVEMNKFIKSVDKGNVWQGLFTVTINDQVILNKAKGYFNNIPGDGNGDIARLYIEGEDIYFDIEYINFGLAYDSKINANYEKKQKDTFEITAERYLSGNASITYKNHNEIDTEKNDSLNLRIYSNQQKGRLQFNEIPFMNRKYITAVPGETYTFKNDSASGKFFLKQSGGIIMDEFEGTLTGLSGNSMSLKSADHMIAVDMSVDDVKEDDPFKQYYSGQGLMHGSGSDFENTCVQHNDSRRLSDLPFTLTLMEDKTKAVLKIKEGFEPEGWYYSYASYIGENDVYSKYHSKYGSRETILDISPSYGAHNLQFTYYNSDPYVYKSKFDILFKIVNGEIFYTDCQESVVENKNYSGTEGFDMMKQYLIQRSFYDFAD